MNSGREPQEVAIVGLKNGEITENLDVICTGENGDREFKIKWTVLASFLKVSETIDIDTLLDLFPLNCSVTVSNKEIVSLM